MKSNRAAWMRGNFGLMTHWLYQPVDTAVAEGSVEERVSEWNKRVDDFDVDALVEQLARTGAKWFILTIGQNTGFYCSPNPVYDELTGAALSKCSKRDLFRDLALAAQKKGIKALAYIPSGAPDRDFDACLKLGWQDGYFRDEDWRAITMPDGVRARRPNHRLADFQKKWERILACWSEAWGELCAGWFVDGVYFADQMYMFEKDPNFRSLAAALRAGNPNAAICFNHGILRVDQQEVLTEEEDYTSGELNRFLVIPFGWGKASEDTKNAYVDQAQMQFLNFLGTNWGQGTAPRLPDDLTIAWTRYIMENNASVTWDVPTSREGQIPESFVSTLSKINK